VEFQGNSQDRPGEPRGPRHHNVAFCVGQHQHRQAGRPSTSLLHLAHYLDFTHADILTGSPRPEYFDILGSAFPRFDLRIADAVLSIIGLNSEKRLQSSMHLIAERGSQTHLAFLDGYSRIVLGGNTSGRLQLLLAQLPRSPRSLQNSSNRAFVGRCAASTFTELHLSRRNVESLF
jgi:hypothetical protein